MLDYSSRFHRRSIRLTEYDYTQAGAYFVTVVTNQRESIFGEVVNREMRLSEFGDIAAQKWEWLPKQYPYVELDNHIVMPNHFHGILRIIELDNNGRGGSRPAPTKTKPLGQLIGVFKTISAKHINLMRHTPGSHIWQRNYHEHIIRNQVELEDIAGYIFSNPNHWDNDPENTLKI